MDVASFFPVALGDYGGVEALDRALYTLLAVELWHDPLLSIQILAFWIWLERLGIKNVVETIFSLPHALINEFVYEALTGLNCINNPETLVSLQATDLPLTSRFLKRKICLRLLVGNQGIVVFGIYKVVEMCATLLGDEIKDAIRKHTVLSEESLINSFANFGFGGPSNRNDIQPVMPAANRGESSQGIVRVRLQSGQSLSRRFSNTGIPCDIPNRINIQSSPLPPEERSMFITFSKGYPVTEAELTNFFTMVFVDCIESFHMQRVRPGEQALYARVVFRLPLVIDLVLNGLPKAKFTINGKHLWMRKFIPRYSASSSSSAGAGAGSSSGAPPVSP